ncbi:transcriptional regulator [Novosphingobium lindaniclasticum LE124]|uniref:Integration host factor subunit alpha n=2 Tax=Novosphingobium TaxID=165696 RepID=T0IQ00_9SPHN|nr:transcriptional regulator [Novosphingobium lindaniclasticum LE124]
MNRCRGALLFPHFFLILSGGLSHGGDAGLMRSTDTLTRAEIAEAIHRKLGLSRSESLAMVETILQHMSDALSQGENVKISGFGTFLLRDKGERIGRNPKTGVEVPITPRRVMTFRASQMLKDRITD